MKSMMKAGTAALALAAAFAIAPAAADSYSSSYNDNSSSYSYHHKHHHQSMSDMSSRDQMQARNVPAAMQVPLPTVRDLGKMKDANVRDEDGNSVGQVRDVVVARDGGARAVKVAIGGFWGFGTKKVITLDARDLLYERDRNELTADLSKHQIDTMEPFRG